MLLGKKELCKRYAVQQWTWRVIGRKLLFWPRYLSWLAFIDKTMYVSMCLYRHSLEASLCLVYVQHVLLMRSQLGAPTPEKFEQISTRPVMSNKRCPCCPKKFEYSAVPVKIAKLNRYAMRRQFFCCTLSYISCRPPSATFGYLRPPSATFGHLRPPSATFGHLWPHSATFGRRRLIRFYARWL